jgi:hypothetical protein
MNTVYHRLKSWIELVYLEWGPFKAKNEEFEEVFVIIVNSLLEDYSNDYEEEIERVTNIIDNVICTLEDEYLRNDQFEYLFILQGLIDHIAGKED